MPKELPYFKFEPAEYLTKDISFCSLEAQGLFINLCCYYWQRECKLTTTQFLRRFPKDKLFKELIDEGVIDIDGDFISVKFLDIQLANAIKTSETNSKNGKKGGRPKNPNKSETKPNKNPNKSETKGIREDKIIEDKINIDWDRLLELFNNKFGRRVRVIPDKAKKQIRDRFKEGYSKQDFLVAMDNAKKDQYHIDNNYKYITLEFLSRPDKFERYSSNHNFKTHSKIL